MIDAAEMIDRLIYANYVHNRERSPHITPQAWKAIYPNVDSMEARYQQSINAYVNDAIKRDQLARHEGSPDQDLDTYGRPLKVGT